MKKQIMIVASMFTVLLLLGTMFNVAAVPKENPFQVIWQAISGLEGQIDYLLARVGGQQTQVDNLAAKVAGQQTQINDLTAQIGELEAEIDILSSKGLGAPDYDSGWINPFVPGVPSGPGCRLIQHNLDTTSIFVYILEKTTDGYIYNINIVGAEGCQYLMPSTWFTYSSNVIGFRKNYGDELGALGYQWRIMIWKIPEP